MKKLAVAFVATLSLLALVGCDQATTTKTITKTVHDTETVGINPVKVGDAIVGGFTVSAVDENSTGYIATRDFRLSTGAVGVAAADATFTTKLNDMTTGYPTVKHVEQTTSAGAKSTTETDTTKQYFSVFRREALITGTWHKDVTLTADTEWTLAGPVFIGGDNANNAILTVEAGTIVKGTASSIAPGMLVVTRGSKIMAAGTAALPIIFTSAKAVGSRAPGDWGGLVINGNAPVNDGDAKTGTAPYTSTGKDTGEGNTGYYGGNNADDNSGVLTYVRSEFAGVRFTADNELNGIAFQGVGRGTTIDYIQAHLSNDDGIEMFGGTANIKHLVSTGNLDDYLDWTSGWTGAVQYAVLQQYPLLGIDNGFEGDGKENDVTATPYSDPYFANFTIVGANDTSTLKTGATFRRGTKVTVVNTIFTNFKTAFKETDSSGSAFLDGSNVSGVKYQGVLAQATSLAVTGTGAYNGVTYTTAYPTFTSFVSGTTGNLYETLTGAANNLTAFPAVLASGKYSLTVAPAAAPTGVTAQTVTASVNGATLDATTYVGAVAPGTAESAAWYAGWTTTAAN